MTKKEYRNYCLAKVVVVVFGLLVFLAAIGWAGDMDYTDQCILRMSYEEYDAIKDSLTNKYGHEPSERDIAHWWAKHHKR